LHIHQSLLDWLVEMIGVSLLELKTDHLLMMEEKVDYLFVGMDDHNLLLVLFLRMIDYLMMNVDDMLLVMLVVHNMLLVTLLVDNM